MIENFGDTRNTKGFDVNKTNINTSGRSPSIKGQIKKLLLKDGEARIRKCNLIRETKEFYIFKIPTQKALAANLLDMAMGDGANGFQALKLILETFDGRAKQEIGADTNPPAIIFQNVSKQFDFDKNGEVIER